MPYKQKHLAIGAFTYWVGSGWVWFWLSKNPFITEQWSPRGCGHEIPTLFFSRLPPPKTAVLSGGSLSVSCVPPAGAHPATLVGILSLSPSSGDGVLYLGTLNGVLGTGALCLVGIQVQF